VAQLLSRPPPFSPPGNFPLDFLVTSVITPFLLHLFLLTFKFNSFFRVSPLANLVEVYFFFPRPPYPSSDFFLFFRSIFSSPSFLCLFPPPILLPRFSRPLPPNPFYRCPNFSNRPASPSSDLFSLFGLSASKKVKFLPFFLPYYPLRLSTLYMGEDSSPTSPSYLPSESPFLPSSGASPCGTNLLAEGIIEGMISCPP